MEQEPFRFGPAGDLSSMSNERLGGIVYISTQATRHTHRYTTHQKAMYDKER
jgi:hypothetical protein